MVDVYGVFYIPLYIFSITKSVLVVIHIDVGYLGVARSDRLGNAKAFEVWD
jgi:hypothetical protein